MVRLPVRLTLLQLLCLLGLAGLAQAADAPARTSTPPGWPLALTLPAAGALQVAGQAGVGASDLGGDDLHWRNAAAQSAGGQVYGLNCAHVKLGATKPDAVGTPPSPDSERILAEVERRLQGRHGDCIGARRSVDIGGRAWTRWQVTQPVKAADGTAGRVDYLLFATASPGGFVYAEVLFGYPPEADVDVDAWAEEVLAGPAQKHPDGNKAKG